MTGLDSFDEQLDALETALGGAQAMTAGFVFELKGMHSTVSDLSADVNTLSSGISSGLRKAFDGLVFDGMKLSDALKDVAQSMSQAAYNAAIKPVAGHFGDILGQAVGAVTNAFWPFEKGGAFAQGRVVPFAKGGVVSSATTFPMRGATGLMGEAGPEAIMPLARGADGRLGVQTGGGGRPVNITMNISTPDVEGFRRSQSQIAAQMSRALSRGQRHR
ncbi:phage tail tape measure protein, lambda family [Aliiroseovarius sediminilitoris]|uniref:Phage tail tape measure protein, lambda family n=1 Tax=Aliiroseovarius sediminilitoris TaxID=1173584 RepID=A0A1I0Q1F5_9RHOB|nr:phage tail tape measure protein [Aliiroseovarius sediminilitoris]SEW20629.1 phage tail tape measure protein, lambda family [Aliiroseovarius sediminilitoris]